MEEKMIEKNKMNLIAKKKVYTQPTLTVYGKLAELTAAGTGKNPEGGSSSKNLQKA